MIDLAGRLDERDRAENDPEMPRLGGRTLRPDKVGRPVSPPAFSVVREGASMSWMLRLPR